MKKMLIVIVPGALIARALWVWFRAAGVVGDKSKAVAGWSQASIADKLTWTLRDYFA